MKFKALGAAFCSLMALAQAQSNLIQRTSSLLRSYGAYLPKVAASRAFPAPLQGSSFQVPSVFSLKSSFTEPAPRPVSLLSSSSFSGVVRHLLPDDQRHDDRQQHSSSHQGSRRRFYNSRGEQRTPGMGVALSAMASITAVITQADQEHLEKEFDSKAEMALLLLERGPEGLLGDEAPYIDALCWLIEHRDILLAHLDTPRKAIFGDVLGKMAAVVLARPINDSFSEGILQLCQKKGRELFTSDFYYEWATEGLDARDMRGANILLFLLPVLPKCVHTLSPEGLIELSRVTSTLDNKSRNWYWKNEKDTLLSWMLYSKFFVADSSLAAHEISVRWDYASLRKVIGLYKPGATDTLMCIKMILQRKNASSADKEEFLQRVIQDSTGTLTSLYISLKERFGDTAHTVPSLGSLLLETCSSQPSFLSAIKTSPHLFNFSDTALRLEDLSADEIRQALTDPAPAGERVQRIAGILHWHAQLPNAPLHPVTAASFQEYRLTLNALLPQVVKDAAHPFERGEKRGLSYLLTHGKVSYTLSETCLMYIKGNDAFSVKVLSKPKIQAMVKSIFQREEKASEEGKISFYHGQDKNFGFLGELALAFQHGSYFPLSQPTDGSFLRLQTHLDSTLFRVHERMQQETTTKQLVKGGRELFFTNMSLFGNWKRSGACTFAYFLENNSAFSNKIDELLATFKLTKEEEKEARSLMVLYYKALGNHGNLLQVQLDRKWVAQNVVTGGAYGAVQTFVLGGLYKNPVQMYDMLMTNPSLTEKLQTDYEFIIPVNQHAGSLIDPANSSVQIYRNHIIDDEQAYKEFVSGINALVKKVQARKAATYKPTESFCECIRKPKNCKHIAGEDATWNEYRRLIAGAAYYTPGLSQRAQACPQTKPQ